jgi:hypothetical protein
VEVNSRNQSWPIGNNEVSDEPTIEWYGELLSNLNLRIKQPQIRAALVCTGQVAASLPYALIQKLLSKR